MTATTVRAESMRRTETPNAVMTTLASPTQGPTTRLSFWKIAMRAGQQGPRHLVDREQVWHLLSGAADVAVGPGTVRILAGDAVVLPAHAERQITAITATEFIACGDGTAVATVVGEDRPRGTPPWIS